MFRACVFVLVALAAACGRDSNAGSAPADPVAAARQELGKMLFFDPRLSGTGKTSCSTCHHADKAWTDGRKTAPKDDGSMNTRNAPTMYSVGKLDRWYWDGRAPSLERQVLGAWSGGNMGATGANNKPSVDAKVAELNKIAGYKPYFQKAFKKDAITKEDAAAALACFMRTIVSVDSPWVKFRQGDKKAFKKDAQRGWAIFDQKAKCTNCHDGRLLTDMEFHNVGVGMDAATPDLGRGGITKEDKDKGAFKTPTLLEIANSAPYFHNGSAKTLEEAVDQMLAGGKKNQWLDTTNLKEVKLSAKEKKDLLAFLRALTVNNTITEPTLPQ